MKNYPFSTFLILIFLLKLFDLPAQQPVDLASIPYYYCGFEDPAENALWTRDSQHTTIFNPNEWAIGTAVSCDGVSALYISADGGATCGHKSTTGYEEYVSAYRDFEFPAGKYQVSFDFLKPRLEGIMYVCLLPEIVWDIVEVGAYGGYWSGISSGTVPQWVLDYAQPWNSKNDKVIARASLWKNGTFEVNNPSPGKWRLLFFWSSKDDSGNLYGGAVDNIQINPISCGKVTSINYKEEDGQGIFTWTGGTGSGTKYEFMYKETKAGNDDWEVQTDLTQRSCTIDSPLDEGIYMFRVRIICSGDTSVWHHFYSHPVFGLECLDFWDIHNKNVATANYGFFDNPYLHSGVIDNGPDSKESRLTLHTDIGEGDPWTNYKLKTIPDDGIVSVRLGNWDNGREAESVTYKYFVESDAKLLLMNYAVVLENPQPPHKHEQQPKFTLEILDEDDSLIGGDCGEEEFVTGTNTNDWDIESIVDDEGGIYEIHWKDWTNIGLNLEKHIGKTLRIRLTTYDCSQGQHFGYAYFTLKCISSAIQGLTCGDEEIKTLEAPEGFTYEWRDKNDPSGKVITTDRWFSPSPDVTTIYECKMFFKDDCSFTQDVNVAPRYPISDFEYKIDFVDCEAVVHFTNKSYVKVGESGRESIEICEWDFGNGSTSTQKNSSTTYTENDTYFVELISRMDELECTDTIRYPVVIAGLGDYDNDTVKRHLCTSDIPYIHDGVEYYQTDTHILPYKSRQACDSTIILQIEFHDLFEIEIEEILYQYKDPYYDFNGRHLTESGIYIDTLQSQGGCDSIVTLILTSYEAAHFQQIDSYPTACADDDNIQFTYEILSGDFTTYSLKFDEKAEQAGFQSYQNISKPAVEGIIEVSIPHGVIPGNYSVELTFEDEIYGYYTHYISFTIYYPGSIAEQKWNDVITLLNDKHNGGYEFSNYQWYKNGYPISGATHSYYYEPGDLDFDAEYIVEITRKDDGVTTFTCPIEIEKRADNGNMYPTIVSSGSSITLDMQESGQGVLWDIMGLKHREYNLQSENNQLTMPSKPGVYYLQIKTDSGERQILNIIVR